MTDEERTQKHLYRCNRCLPNPEVLSEIMDIERRSIIARAHDLERTTPRFASRQELLAALEELLHREAAEQPEYDRFLAHEATREQFSLVVSEFAVDGLVESQAHLPIIPRLPPKTRMAVFRVLIDEFGCGNSEQEHSQLYRDLLTELGMPTDLDHYIEIVSEPSLAYVNLFSWLAARAPAEEYFLGAYAYFESSVLSAFQSFATAAERLGIHNRRYYTEHLYIDSFHSRQMLEAIKALEDERPINLAKIWTGVLLTSATVAEATEAAVTKARNSA